jgi:hypothetical protein
VAVEVASLKAVLDLDKRGLDTGLKSASQGLKGFGSSIGGAMAMLGGIGAAVGAFSVVTSAVGDMIGAAREGIAVEKELNAVLLSTKEVAGVNAGMAKELANSLSLVTNFQDDAILKGEAMLLTFTKIGKDVFPQATEAALDYAEKMGVDVVQANMVVGKALNDPIKGVGALTRAGVQFTPVQKQMIKDFMAVNDLAGAQGIVLGELNTQMGGMARAMADPFIQVQNAIGEVQEMLGMGIMPMLLEVANAVLPALRAAAAGAGPALGEFGVALGKAFGSNLADIIGLFVDLATHFSTFLQGVNDLGVAFGMSGEQAKGFNVLLLPLKITFTLIGAALHILGATFSSIAFIVTKVSAGFTALTGAGGQLQSLGNALSVTWNVLSAAGTTLSQIIQIIGMAWANLIRVMSQPFNPPPLLTPGSPTPMELGLRGLSGAIKSIPPLPSLGGAGGMAGMVPLASGGSSTINITVGNVSASTTTNGDANTEAIRMTIQLLRQQLDR